MRVVSARGNSDNSNAIAPVTKGAAALVPPDICGLPFVPRLVIPTPGAIRPRRPIDHPKFDSGRGLPRKSQAATGITAGWRVITELPTRLSLPAAVTTITPREAA